MIALMTCLVLALPSAADSTSPEETARALVNALAKENFAAVTKDFDEAMRKALPEEKLSALWKGLVGQVGTLKSTGAIQREKVEKYDVCWIPCEFEKTKLFTRVVLSAEGKVSGLSFRPTGPAGEYKPPAYVKRDTFQEQEVTVGEGEWAVPGTISMPGMAKSVPGIVLVHGSGPQDRDETIGPNRPFRDLAWGLASHGIAVLRYEKRTLRHGLRLKPEMVTIKEEVLDDALAAAALLRKTPGIDPRKVFILGHSLGAMAAPRLGELDPQLAGLLILAAPARLLEDIVIEQFTYLFSLNGGPSDAQKEQLEKIKEQVARLKDPKLPADTPASQLPLGAPLAYWRSVHSLRSTEIATQLKMPLLLLHGERDYQVAMEDYHLWQKALRGRSGVQLKSYPNLNHLFMEGKGKALPTEYQKEGHVAQEVIDDLVKWVKERR